MRNSKSEFSSLRDVYTDLVSSKIKSNFIIESFHEIKLDLSTNALIDDLIDNKSFVLLVGESNAGKTFAALDISFSIARGISWLGRDVKKGAVLYVAAEGGNAIKKRIIAYRRENLLDETSLPFRLVRGAIDLKEPSVSTLHLIEEAKNTEGLYGEPVRLIVIDTLNRALPGGDENSSSDMGDLIKNIDYLRQETGATVMVIHHTGKDITKGARGHSSLKGAIDTELLLKKDQKGHSIKITKQRDYEVGPSFRFQLKSVEIGENEAGKIITSCVLVYDSENSFKEESSAVLTGNPLNAFETLMELFKESSSVSVETWRKTFIKQHCEGKARQTQSSNFLKAKEKLLELGYIRLEVEDIFIIKKP